MKLYGYFRSSAAYRVRIALNLKGLAYEQVAVNLVRDEQRSEDSLVRNPQGLVPVLETDEGRWLTQSLAICEYLEERHPEPSILPDDLEGRARVRALSQVVASEIHPLNNLRVLKYLTGELGIEDERKLDWYRHWIHEGFLAMETMLAGASETGDFCHGSVPTLADICLVPQVFNARRFDCDLSDYPTILRIADHCDKLPCFADARPECQPDSL
ncbi:MAG TPA: maleylacetoacetate isomerase [Marinobacter sp.]|uniref:maleylacetoacetate isomerase n=1 Tax=Marinobacter sp. TaxID=50741 RepID=UPI002D802889|nr:maleylacetoacetate isomerase [Marinobacter sp.]HET8800320.1 maleylacetoacetate isomerase [Marinobacter sp.]